MKRGEFQVVWLYGLYGFYGYTGYMGSTVRFYGYTGSTVRFVFYVSGATPRFAPITEPNLKRKT